MIALVLQSFGKKSEYRRTIFAIWSFYACANVDSKSTEVILFTDDPGYFKPYFKEMSIRYITLTYDKIKEMRGAIDFLHRMKIALIEEAFEIAQSNLLYIDSDTFFINNISNEIVKLSSDVSFMHKQEYAFSSLKNMRLPAAIPFHAFLNLIEQNQFALSNKELVNINAEQSSWNAGAMLLHQDHKRLIPDVYSLTDQFYIPTKNHASEQYAFSVILQNNTELRPLDKCIYHYWYRIEKIIADQFFEDKISLEWALVTNKQKLSDVRNWSEFLPRHFNRHILMLRDKAIQAFNEDQFKRGYWFSTRAFIRNPFNLKFIKDIAYHTKRAVFDIKAFRA